MPLPSNVSFGTVVGRFLTATADGTDADRDPDGIAATGLSIVFSPALTPALVRDASASPPVVFALSPVSATVGADGTLLGPDGAAGVRLVASTNPNLEPTGWPWTVSLSGPAFPSLSFSFVLDPGTTVDLASVVQVPAGPGQTLAQWLQAVTDAQAARDAAVAAAASVPSAAELTATYVAKQHPVTVGVPLYGRGTSYMAGAASSSAATSFFGLVAAALGSTETHNGGNGGSTTPALVYQYAADTANLWTPGTSTGVVLIEAGIGEATQESSSFWTGHRNVFENKIVTALRWHRATGRKIGNDPSIVIDGAGVTYETLNGFPAWNLDPGVKITGTSGVTITAPAFATPTDLVLLTVPWAEPNGADSGDNGGFRYRVNGGAWRTGTTKGQGDPRPDGSNDLLTISSTRIRDVPSGATIRFEATGNGNVWLDGYLVMGNPAPPPIVLINDVYLVEASGQWTFPNGSPITADPHRNDATLDVYRDIMRRIATSPEFADGTVVVADPNPRFDPATMLSTADGLHPTDAGHAVYAGAILDAFQSLA